MKKIERKRNKRFLKQMGKNEKGITLVALVITIIIIIILATVTINMAFGDNGLIKQAQLAKDMSANSVAAEQEGMNSLMDEYANLMAEDSEIPIEPTVPETVADAKPGDGESVYIFENTTKIIDDSGDDVWIPGGFGVHEDSAIDADNGIVITDETNEFVWIPVQDYTIMYEDTKEEIALSGSSLGLTVKTNIYSNLWIREPDDITFKADVPGSTNAREPDILIDVTDGDIIVEDSAKGIEQIKNVIGIEGNTEKEILNNFAKSLVEEYKAIYESIKTYKGFYIGRYELTGSIERPSVMRGQEVLTSNSLQAKNWYGLKKACSDIVNTEYAQTAMIYGNQWDQVMKWLKETTFKNDTSKVDLDSSEWGNYSSSSIQVAGSNELWKANNIYDLAGNCVEWTQEAIESRGRTGRGGGYYSSGSIHPVSAREYDVPHNSNIYASSRPILYIKK